MTALDDYIRLVDEVVSRERDDDKRARLLLELLHDAEQARRSFAAPMLEHLALTGARFTCRHWHERRSDFVCAGAVVALDANEPDCFFESPRDTMYVCSLPAGHAGWHVAECEDGEVVEAWPPEVES